MIFVDAHCDTITKIMECDANLFENHCHIDLHRLKQTGKAVQFFAAFIDPSYGQAYAMRRAVEVIDMYYGQIHKYNNDIMSCCNYNEIMNAVDAGKVAAILSIEGGEALQGSLPALRMFYRLGVRSICLTWNHRNEIADGVSDASSGGGLTPFGKEVIHEMNRLGMLVDVSHISEKGFWDVIEATRAPIIASHSNAKAICNHRRNLTDDQILAVKKNQGVIGINLYPHFLNNSGKATMEDVVKHIEYIIGLVGADHLGMGADFDGIESTPEGIGGIQDIPQIFNTLAKLNYSQEIIEKIAGANYLRVIKEVL